MTGDGGERVAALTDERLLRRNVLLNLAGWALPAVAALLAIPMLARGLGPARFGLVAVAWAVVGMLSIFDFGLSRALTRLVAERAACGDEADVPDLVWTAAWLIFGATAVLAALGFVLSPWMATRLLHVPAGLEGEARTVVRWLVVALVPVAQGAMLRGVFEAVQRSGIVNGLRVPLGVVTYAGPLVALPLGGSAATATAVIVIGRTLYWLAHLPALELVRRGMSRMRLPSGAAAREILRTGGWITVSNVVSPLIVQGDRFAVAVALPIAASGWYGIASEVATKQWLFTAALQPVLFAALSASLVHDPARAEALIARAARVTMMVLLPVALALVVFAEPGLRLWMGSAYAPGAATALRWLAVGVLVNASAQVPYAALQGGAHARAPALLHLIELPLYAVLLVVLVRWRGLEGAAIACFARMTIDGVAMWWLAATRVRGAAAAFRGSLLPW